MAAISLLYGAAIRGRNALYDAGMIRAERLAGPVVSIGNIAQREKPAAHRQPFRLSAMAVNSLKTLKFVGGYVLVGIVLGAAVEVLVPGRFVTVLFGSGGWYQILLAAVLGIPLYACGGGTIPLVHGLMDRGMAGGAALAFLIAGPATRIPPLAALATVVRPWVVMAYVIFLVAYSVLAGLFYGVL